MSADPFAPRLRQYLLLFMVLGEGRARLVYAKWSRFPFSTVKLDGFGSFSLYTQLWPLWEPPGWPGVSGCLLDASWVPLGCLLGGSWVSPGCLLAASWACPGWLLVNPPQDYLAACSRIANTPTVWGLTLESLLKVTGVVP